MNICKTVFELFRDFQKTVFGAIYPCFYPQLNEPKKCRGQTGSGKFLKITKLT